MDFRENFKATLKRLREHANLTQEQLADACGFQSQSRIGNYEAGRGLPSIPDLLTMARVLQVDICEFFGRASFATRLDPEMIEDVIFALGVAKNGRFHEGSARDFVEYYELRTGMPSQPSTPRNTLELVARAKSGTGDGRDTPLHAIGAPKGARRKGKA